MSRQEIARRINSIGGDVHRLTQDIAALQSANTANNLDYYYGLSQQAALQAENIALRLRRLVYDSTSQPKAAYLAGAACKLGIIAYESNGIVEITLPCLIPKRSKKAMAFITDPLLVALDTFISGRQPPFKLFTNCVICITHVYDKTLPTTGRVRDHDNIELKGIIDAVNTYLLTDDSGILCNIYSASELGSNDMTHISIMDKGMFPAWILRHQNTP